MIPAWWGWYGEEISPASRCGNTQPPPPAETMLCAPGSGDSTCPPALLQSNRGQARLQSTGLATGNLNGEASKDAARFLEASLISAVPAAPCPDSTYTHYPRMGSFFPWYGRDQNFIGFIASLATFGQQHWAPESPVSATFYFCYVLFSGGVFF